MKLFVPTFGATFPRPTFQLPKQIHFNGLFIKQFQGDSFTASVGNSDQQLHFTAPSFAFAGLSLWGDLYLYTCSAAAATVFIRHLLNEHISSSSSSI